MHNTLGSAYWNGAFLHDDLIAVGNACDESCASFNMLKIGSATFAAAIDLCRRIHRDENQLCLIDRRLNVVGEKKIPSSALFHDVVQAGL